MTDKSLKNKILSFFNPTNEGSTFSIVSTNVGKEQQKQYKLSQSTIHRNSYLSKDETLCRKREVGESRRKKKKFLNVVSNPHRQDLSSSKVNLTDNLGSKSRLKISRFSKMSQESERQVKRSDSLKSVQTLSVHIESKVLKQSQQRPSLIIQEKIVPVLIQTSDKPTNWTQGREDQPPTPVQKLINIESKDSSGNQINRRHSHLHRTQGFNKIPVQHVVNNQVQGSRPVNQSPELRMHTPSNAYTPIQSFVPSPQTGTPTITDRSIFQRNQDLKCNIQINTKLNLNSSKQSMSSSIPDHMKFNPHQKAVSILSDPLFAQAPPAFRKIEVISLMQNKKAESPKEQNKKIETSKFPQENSFKSHASKSKSVLSSQHKLEHSPHPVQHRKENSCIVTGSEKSLADIDIFQKPNEGLPKTSPLLLKNKRKNSSFFKQYQQNEPGRQNYFFRVMSQELNSINSQRIQTESRISRRLDELSERATSMVRMYSEEFKKVQDSPTKQQPLMKVQDNQKKLLILNQEKPKIKACNICTQSMKLSFSGPDKENLIQSTSKQIRKQILTKIFA